MLQPVDENYRDKTLMQALYDNWYMNTKSSIQ